MKSMKSLVNFAIVLLLIGGFAYEGIWKWMICRRYVPAGKSLLVMFRGNLIAGKTDAAEGDFARVENGRPVERGFLMEMAGPGRHFEFDPIHYQCTEVDDVVIAPGQVGIVYCKLGKDLPTGQFLVDGDVGKTKEKGVLRKVLKPGRYRINPYGYEVKPETMPDRPANAATARRGQQGNAPTGKLGGWIEIEPGYVGVVTNLAADPVRGTKAGIQEEVLQPGIYAVNPKEQQVDIIGVGYQVTTIKAELSKDDRGKLLLDENGEPIARKGGAAGITFPSIDGFSISLDFTTVWGLMPDQAPKVISLYGTLENVEKNVIRPEIESICRINGSRLGAVELLTGNNRESFQNNVSENVKKILTEKEISLQVGLVRHIYIPPAVRGPIQKANIADETKLTTDMEGDSKKIEANLEEARSMVTLQEKTVTSETEKLYQEAMAKGEKVVAEIEADTGRLVAVIARKTAEVDAQATLLLGAAEANVSKLKKEAEAQKFELAVKAFGSPDAYNQYVFATGLPADINLNLFYAGPGTFWTDLKGFQDVGMAKNLQQGQAKEAKDAETILKSVLPK